MPGRNPRQQLCHFTRVIIRNQCRVTGQPLRQFGSTAPKRKHGGIPSLEAPIGSSPELLELLHKIRTKIFLPAHLTNPQRSLIFAQKNWKQLRNDPISVEIGSESYVLEPIDRTKDCPDKWASLVSAIKLMGEDEATWRLCFVNLLKGFKQSGRTWRDWQISHVVRKAGERGMIAYVVEAAKSGKETGVTLDSVRVMREALWGCRRLMLKDEENEGLALRYAETLAELSDNKIHAGGMEKDLNDPRVQPDCIGVLVELAALCGEKDKTKAYLERLLTNLEKGIRMDLDEEEQRLKRTGKTAALGDYELMRWIPVVRGLNEAINLLGDGTPNMQRAKEQLERFNRRVQDFKQMVDTANDTKKDTRQGLKWYSL